MQRPETVQIKREVSSMAKRLDRLEFILRKLLNQKGRRTSSLDRGLIELMSGKVRRYRSLPELSKDVWG